MAEDLKFAAKIKTKMVITCYHSWTLRRLVHSIQKIQVLCTVTLEEMKKLSRKRNTNFSWEELSDLGKNTYKNKWMSNNLAKAKFSA